MLLLLFILPATAALDPLWACRKMLSPWFDGQARAHGYADTPLFLREVHGDPCSEWLRAAGAGCDMLPRLEATDIAVRPDVTAGLAQKMREFFDDAWGCRHSWWGFGGAEP